MLQPNSYAFKWTAGEMLFQDRRHLRLAPLNATLGGSYSGRLRKLRGHATGGATDTCVTSLECENAVLYADAQGGASNGD